MPCPKEQIISSPLIKKGWCKCNFLYHSREAMSNELCVLFQLNRVCFYFSLYRTSLMWPTNFANTRSSLKTIRPLNPLNTTDPLPFYLIYLRYMKDIFSTKFRLTLMKSCLNIHVDFAKNLMHKSAWYAW